ncbi:MAG TPA: aldehyde dehydrogenase family protein [Steroidobacteraceae bacterium]|jgi:acyl-CoA reductase-like NAD-dependent aldehyde dehydrogenase|nr:aldehyde dehydrogenase family protein [Steroidobacteraceae bacterium]
MNAEPTPNHTADGAAALRSDFANLIDGELVAGKEWFDVLNPATGLAFARAPSVNRSELDAAVGAARRAFDSWRATSVAERRAAIGRMAQILTDNAGALAELLTQEQGKPVGQSRDEIGRAASQSIGMAQIIIADELLEESAQRRIELKYFPLGVVGIITPWNAPINLAAGPLVAALYTGNTVVLKPSPYTPLCTLKIAALLREVFAPGVLNVVAGGDELGEWMTAHPGIDKISFTGSVATGKKVMASCAGTLKRLTLELGGNDAAIVLDDVDPRAIAPKLFFSAFVNSGQVCMAIKRIYAHESIYPELCTALAEEATKARVGSGLESGVQLGPIQNREQYDKVVGILNDTVAHGGRILAGGTVPAGPGYFFPPTIVADIDEHSRLVQEEQFGPILPVLKFTDEEDALRRANDTRFGLSGSVWSADPERGARLAARLEVGTAWVNQHRATSATVPFGGAKESGLGRQYAALGLKGYMEPRVISVLKG